MILNVNCILQDADHLINLIKLEIIEAQRAAVEKTIKYISNKLNEDFSHVPSFLSELTFESILEAE